MRKRVLVILLMMTMTYLLVGCQSNEKANRAGEIALKEANKITNEQGYSIVTSDGDNIMIGDADVFDLIKDASIATGYLSKEFDSMTGERVIIEYELKEKSKENNPIYLGIVVDKGKAIGAYLDYYEHKPGIKPVGFKDFRTD